MIINQIYYPPGFTGSHFKELDNVYINKLLLPYYDINKPCIFFSCFFNINVLKQHIGLALIIINSGLTILNNNMEYFKHRMYECKNLVFLSASSFITKKLTTMGFNYIEFPFNCNNITHQLKPKGDCIYFYSCDDSFNNLYNYGYFRIKNILINYFPHIKLICGKSYPYNSTKEEDTPDNFKIYNNKTELIDIYQKCFLGIRLVTFDGLSDSVQTLGMLGIPTIWNGGTPSGLSYETDDDIIYHIQNEEKKINEIDEELSIHCHNFLNPINYDYIFNADSYTNDNKNFPMLYNNINLPNFSKTFYKNKNIFFINNYYIFHNNIIEYDIKKTNNILKPNNINILHINIHKILNDKHMNIFGIRFNNQLLGIEHKYGDEYLIGQLIVESNLPLKIFNGNNWINSNLNNIIIKNFKIKISTLNKWRVGISNDWLNNNLNTNSVDFIINRIEFKIDEITSL